jgi:hypothetical protein
MLTDRRRVELAIPMVIMADESRKLRVFAGTEVGKATLNLCTLAANEPFSGQVDEKLKRRIGRALQDLQIPAPDEPNELFTFNVGLSFLDVLVRRGYPWNFKSLGRVEGIQNATKLLTSMIENRIAANEFDKETELGGLSLFNQCRKLGYYGA